jgi:hypothetical protein
VFTLAVNDGELIANPCAKGGRLYAGSRVEVIWTSPQVGAFLHQRRYAHMHLPLLIGLWTGTRTTVPQLPKTTIAGERKDCAPDISGQAT